METARAGRRTFHAFVCCLLSAFAPPILGAAGPAPASSLQILDPAGKPLLAAPFRVFAPPASKSLISDFGTKILEGQTDAAGRLPAPLPRLGGLLVVVDHPGFAPFVEEVVPPRNEIRLAAGGLAEGTVSGPPKPARGRVCARWEVPVPTWSRTFPFERCGQIDAEHRWSIVGLGPAPARLTAEIAGFLPASASWKPGAKPLALTLEPGFLIAGRLLDPAGQAVREARLESTGAAPTGVDEKGSFGIALPALPATVRIRAPGFRTRPFEAPAQVPKEPLELRLEWGQQIKGILLDAGGQPLRAKAELQAYRWIPQTEGWTPESFELQPAADGSFEVDLSRPGEYRLRLRAEGLRSEPFPRQWITQGAVLDLGVVAFETGAGVRCRVVDEADGEPIAGVEARLVGRGTGLLAQLQDGGGKTGASDAQGEILMTGAEAGAYRLRLRHDRYAKTSLNLDLERGEIHDCGEVALAPAIEVTGRVITRSGRPMPGSRVRFFEPPADGFEPAAEAVADSEGRFKGARLSAGEHVVWVDRERRLLSQAYTLERPSKERKVEVDLVVPSVQLVVQLVRGGQPIEGGGFVSLTSELDLADARLKMQFQSSDGSGRQMVGVPDRPQSAVVGEDGTVEIADAPAGPARLELIEPDGSSVARRVLVPDQAFAQLTVDLGGAALTGRLVDADTDAGLAGLVEVVDDGGRIVASLQSEADGRFVGLDFAPGTYGLRATAEGYTPAIHKVDLPREGEAPVVVALRPGGDGSLSVHFERSDGGPAAGLVAHLVDGVGRMIGACVADGTGRCRHPRVPPGTYSLAWSDPVAGAGGATPIVAKAGEEIDFEHRLRPGGPLTLRCAQCAGATLEGVVVVTTSGIHVTPYLEGVAPALRFGADGSLVLGRLNAGAYLVQTRVAGRDSQQRIEVRPGESTDLALDAPAPAPGVGSEP
jgi:hypothetical protein